MVRASTAKMPALKHAPPAGDSGFRIRAIGDKTYQIEKRAGESKWDTLASFPIEVASCKIKPGVLKEPPPVTDQDAAKDKDYVEELKLGAAPPAKTTGTPATPLNTPATPPKKGPGL
jgi:hypothetical protein